MKRYLVLLLVLSVLLLGTAWAEGEQGGIATGQIVPIQSGDLFDLDDDGVQEAVGYEILRDEEGYDVGYRLSVGEAEFIGEGWTMHETVHLLRLDDYGSTLLLVSDYGPSDDYETSFFIYADGAIQPVGKIYSMPEGMRVENGVITASVRGTVLHTWFHDADFALAYGWSEEDGQMQAAIHSVPRYLYPMSHIVTSKVELPLLTSMTDHSRCATLAAGEKAVLCATDDVQWVYIESLESEAAGWMRVGGEYGQMCMVGSEAMNSYDVFDGLLFAD